MNPYNSTMQQENICLRKRLLQLHIFVTYGMKLQNYFGKILLISRMRKFLVAIEGVYDGKALSLPHSMATCGLMFLFAEQKSEKQLLF